MDGAAGEGDDGILVYSKGGTGKENVKLRRKK